LALKAPQDFLTLDPVAMNIVNRVAAGCVLSGTLHFDGGLLVQGELSGRIRVDGPLIVWVGGLVRGRIGVRGDLYLFGQLGDTEAEAAATTIECSGMVCVAESGLSTGTLLARRLQLYEGAQVQGPFKTLRPDQELPVLNEVFGEPA
jgi:cytoskeletal protein CcmA (bactofilin family)